MILFYRLFFFFFFNDTATTEIYTLSLHDALPISTNQGVVGSNPAGRANSFKGLIERSTTPYRLVGTFPITLVRGDRKSTRLNSSHSQISYAVFCLKKKKITMNWIL